MRIFLSGPMTGYPNHNFDFFRQIEKALRKKGHDVISGRLLFESEIASGKTRSHAEYQRAALKLMLAFEADAIAQMPGWEESKGATSEAATALALDMMFMDINGNKTKTPDYIAVVNPHKSAT